MSNKLLYFPVRFSAFVRIWWSETRGISADLIIKLVSGEPQKAVIDVIVVYMENNNGNMRFTLECFTNLKSTK